MGEDCCDISKVKVKFDAEGIINIIERLAKENTPQRRHRKQLVDIVFELLCSSDVSGYGKRDRSFFESLSIDELCDKIKRYWRD